jgi:hypothetical protein
VGHQLYGGELMPWVSRGRSRIFIPDPILNIKEKAAADAGFKSAADQETNRMMRNQLEMQAALVGYADPYSLVEGPLTNTAALQAAWNKLPKTPVPAPAPAPAKAPAADNQLAELTAQSQAYRKEAESALEAGRLRISQLEDEDLQRQKATELQNRLAIQAASSQARGQAQASLKIAPGSQTSQTAGTQAFKRRRDRMSIAPIQSTAGINAPSGNILNI